MRNDTKQRKNASKSFQKVSEDDLMLGKMFQIFSEGKRAFDGLMMDMGRMLAESILLMDREEQAGP